MKRAVFFLLLISTLVSCGKMKDPIFKSIENVKMDGLGFRASSVLLDIRYLNPNNFSGKLKQAEGDAWMDTIYLGHFTVDTTIQIPANSEFLVPVKLVVDMKQMLKHSLTAFMNEEVMLKITGTAKAGKSGLYKSFSLNYLGKQNLKKLFSPIPTFP